MKWVVNGVFVRWGCVVRRVRYCFDFLFIECFGLVGEWCFWRLNWLIKEGVLWGEFRFL